MMGTWKNNDTEKKWGRYYPRRVWGKIKEKQNLKNSCLLGFYRGGHTKYIHLYLEYPSVGPLVGLGPPTSSPPNECVPPPPNQRGGWQPRLRVRGWDSPNSDDWRKSLGLCVLWGRTIQKRLLCSLILEYRLCRGIQSNTNLKVFWLQSLDLEVLGYLYLMLSTSVCCQRLHIEITVIKCCICLRAQTLVNQSI